MTLGDARFPCEHGSYDGKHPLWSDKVKGCPGGSPVTIADLEGEKVWWCETHNALQAVRNLPHPTVCERWAGGAFGSPMPKPDCQMVERLLIPIPEPSLV